MVENDVSFYPADVSLLGAKAVVFQAETMFFWLFQVIGYS